MAIPFDIAQIRNMLSTKSVQSTYSSDEEEEADVHSITKVSNIRKSEPVKYYSKFMDDIAEVETRQHRWSMTPPQAGESARFGTTIQDWFGDNSDKIDETFGTTPGRTPRAVKPDRVRPVTTMSTIAETADTTKEIFREETSKGMGSKNSSERETPNETDAAAIIDIPERTERPAEFKSRSPANLRKYTLSKASRASMLEKPDASPFTTPGRAKQNARQSAKASTSASNSPELGGTPRLKKKDKSSIERPDDLQEIPLKASAIAAAHKIMTSRQKRLALAGNERIKNTGVMVDSHSPYSVRGKKSALVVVNPDRGLGDRVTTKEKSNPSQYTGNEDSSEGEFEGEIPPRGKDEYTGVFDYSPELATSTEGAKIIGDVPETHKKQQDAGEGPSDRQPPRGSAAPPLTDANASASRQQGGVAGEGRGGGGGGGGGIGGEEGGAAGGGPGGGGAAGGTPPFHIPGTPQGIPPAGGYVLRFWIAAGPRLLLTVPKNCHQPTFRLAPRQEARDMIICGENPEINHGRTYGIWSRPDPNAPPLFKVDTYGPASQNPPPGTEIGRLTVDLQAGTLKYTADYFGSPYRWECDTRDPVDNSQFFCRPVGDGQMAVAYMAKKGDWCEANSIVSASGIATAKAKGWLLSVRDNISRQNVNLDPLYLRAQEENVGHQVCWHFGKILVTAVLQLEMRRWVKRGAIEPIFALSNWPPRVYKIGYCGRVPWEPTGAVLTAGSLTRP